MGRVMTDTDLPELRDDREIADAAACGTARPVDASPTSSWSRTPAASSRRSGSCSADTSRSRPASSIGPGMLGAVAAALGDPSLALTLITSVGDVDSAAPSRAMWQLSRLDPSSQRVRRRLRRVHRRVRQPWPERMGHPQRGVGDPARARHRARSTACAARATTSRRRRATTRTRRNREAATAKVRERARRPARHARPVRDGARIGAHLPGRSRTHQDERHPRAARGAHGDPRAGRPPRLHDERDVHVARRGGRRLRRRPRRVPAAPHRSRGAVPRAVGLRAAVHRQRQRAAGVDLAAQGSALTVRRRGAGRRAHGRARRPGVATGRARVVLRPGRSVRARTRRRADRPDHRPGVDAAVRARRGGRRQRRCGGEPRRHRRAASSASRAW